MVIKYTCRSSSTIFMFPHDSYRSRCISKRRKTLRFIIINTSQFFYFNLHRRPSYANDDRVFTLRKNLLNQQRIRSENLTN